MTTKATKNTFIKFDTDTSQNKEHSSSFYDAENLRLITDEALSNGALVNFKGTKAKLKLGKEVELKGYAEVGDTLGMLLYQENVIGGEDSTTPLADTAVDNFTSTSSSYNNIQNTTLINPQGGVTVTGPTYSNIELGNILTFYAVGGVPTKFKFLPGFTYKVSYSPVESSTSYHNIPYSLVVGKSSMFGSTDSSKAKITIAKSDVLHLISKPVTSSAAFVEFTVPDTVTSDYYLAFYPNVPTSSGSNYIFNSSSNAVEFSNISIQYKPSSVDYNITETAEIDLEGDTIINCSAVVSEDEETVQMDVYIPLSNIPNSAVYTLQLYSIVDGNLGDPIDFIELYCNPDDTVYGPTYTTDITTDIYTMQNPSASELISVGFFYNRVDLPNDYAFVLKKVAGVSAATEIGNYAIYQYSQPVVTGYMQLSANYLNTPEWYKKQFTPNLVAVLYTHYENGVDKYKTSFIDEDALNFEELDPTTNGGLLKGNKYILPIRCSGAGATSGHIDIIYEEVLDEYIYKTFEVPFSPSSSNITIDLTESNYTGRHVIKFRAGIGETITYTYGNIVRYDPMTVLSGTISDNLDYTLHVSASNVGTSPVSSINFYIVNPTTYAIAETVEVPTNNTTIVLKYSNYNGYKYAISGSPSLVRSNPINLTVTSHKIVAEETILSTLTNNKYYTFKVGATKNLTYNCVDKYLTILVKRTAGGPVETLRTLMVPIKDLLPEEVHLNYFVPNDGATYTLVAVTNSESKDILAGILKNMELSQYSISSGGSMIAKAVITPEDTIQDITILYSDTLSVSKLGFDTINHIEAVGRYDSESVKNIYFAVPNYPLRSFNLAPTPVNPSNADAHTLDLLPNVEGVTVSVDAIINGGTLEAGKIQYACRLFNKYGNETVFSTTSQLISLTESSIYGSAEFKGSDIGATSGKSVRVSVDVTNNSIFNYIKIYSIHYKEKDTPVISLISELPINGGTVSFIDTGAILAPITIEEFNIFGGRFISAETISSKNNILFAGNISEQISIITEEDLDCRSYRFNNSTPKKSKVFQEDGSYYLIETNGSWQKYTAADVQETGTGKSGTGWSLPITADCINKYNNEFLVPNGGTVHPFPYMYQSDGTTLGGTGKIIDYKIKAADAYTKLVDNGETVITDNNIDYILKSTSFKQGETYRIGITFYDLKGKPFFNRWIGDVRIPYMDLFISKYTRTDTGNTENVEMSVRNIYLEVTVKTANIPQEIKDKISGFQITKVERTAVNKSVVAQGYSTGGITYDTGTSKYLLRGLPVPTTFSVNAGLDTFKVNFPYMTQFISPEFNINGGVELSGDYRLKVVKILANPVNRLRAEVDITNTTSGWLMNKYFHIQVPAPASNSSSKILYPLTEVVFNNGTYTQLITTLTGTSIVPNYSFNLNSIVKVGKEEVDNGGAQLNPNSIPIRILNRTASDHHCSEVSGGTTHTGYGATGLLMSSTTSIPYNNDFSTVYTELPAYGNPKSYIYLFDLYKDIALSIYSGNTYNSRTKNTYHAISTFTPLTAPTVNAYGDVYSTVFDTLYGYNDANIEDAQTDDKIYASDVSRRQYVGIFPIESSVNAMLVSNKPSKWIFNYPSGRNLDSKYTGLMEKAIDGANIYGNKYPNVGDFDKYNTAYSAINKYPILVQEPLLFQEILRQPATIISSEPSVSGDLVDNWTKFLVGNFIDLDSVHGPVHKLTSFDNKLYFLQEEAIGTVAVKDRYILTDGPTQLALGTGDVLERYDYLKYNTGILNPSQAINITSGLYYVDIDRGVINTLRELDVSLSLEKGVNSLVRSLLNQDSIIELGYDPKYNELYITILNDLTSKTLVYNENIGQFAPNIGYKPDQWVSLKNGNYSYIKSITGVDNYIYRHGVGEYNEIYTEAALPLSGYTTSYVSVIVNPNANVVNIYDVVDFRTEVLDSSANIFNDENTYETVNFIDFKNSYQSVSKNILVKGATNVTPNTSRRFRSWTTQVPLTTTRKRFLDTFLSLTFKYVGGSNKIFKLHDIITYYREYHK